MKVITTMHLEIRYSKSEPHPAGDGELTHWGQVTHICVSKLTIIGSHNGLSPGWRQAIIWVNSRILLIGPLGTNFSEILIIIYTFSFKKIHLERSSGNWRPFCLGLSVLRSKINNMTYMWESISFHVMAVPIHFKTNIFFTIVIFHWWRQSICDKSSQGVVRSCT